MGRCGAVPLGQPMTELSVIRIFEQFVRFCLKIVNDNLPVTENGAKDVVLCVLFDNRLFHSRNRKSSPSDFSRHCQGIQLRPPLREMRNKGEKPKKRCIFPYFASRRNKDVS